MTLPSQPSLHRPSLGIRTFVLCVSAIALFAANLFLFQPWLARQDLQQVGFFTYIGVRIVGFVALSFLMVFWAKRNRYQTLSTLMLIGAIDQVVLKFISTKAALLENPSLFGPEGIPSDMTLFYGLAAGFLFFAPILLILGFLGVELNRFAGDWKRKHSSTT